MGIIFEQEIAKEMRRKLILNPFPTQKELNQMRDEAIEKYNINYAAIHPEVRLADQNNNLTSVSQNQIQNLISSLIPATKPNTTYTIRKVFDAMLLKENPDCFWLCMIGLFTGARANVAMTLQYQDLVDENGLACLYFRSNHPVKNLKNEASERKVPIHKQLLDVGFVDYVKRKQ